MTRVHRLERLIAITKQISDRPCHLFSLNYFSEEFDVAKSTLSEDLTVIKAGLQEYHLGTLETVAGAAGGVRFLPCSWKNNTQILLADIAVKLAEPERIIPGGFLYMSDILFAPHLMAQIGEVFMTEFAGSRPNYIMTVETKGIPLAFMTARAFDLPLVTVRRGSKVTEGSAVSINYVTGSSKRIQTMSLPKRSLPPKARVLIIDDFMKAGGTARGMIDLAQEFGAEVVGVGVLVATAEPDKKLVDEYFTLLMLHNVDEHNKQTDDS